MHPEDVLEVYPLSVLHIGAGRYSAEDRSHSTFEIWRSLAKGFLRYTVVGRSDHGSAGRIEEGNLSVRLLPSWRKREAEFLFTQFGALKIAAEVRPDVVVSQCPVQGGLVAMRIARKYGARVLIEIHMANYLRPARVISKDSLLQTLSRGPLAGAHGIRVLSETMRQQLLSRYGRTLASKVTILPPRVDLGRFEHTKETWAVDERFCLVIVGSVTRRKGQLRLINALFGHGMDVDLWIVGDGPELCACRDRVAQLGAQDRVKFWGQIPHSQLAALLPQADALVCYSEMEGTPRAIMEGMAAGLPILTTDAGYCADVVRDGIDGIVLRGDIDVAMRAALRSLMSNESRREVMGLAGRSRAAMEFNAALLYKCYRALIRDVATA